MCCCILFFFQAEDGIRDLVRSRGLGDVYKRQLLSWQVVAGLPDSMAYLVEIGFSLGGVFDWRVAEATTNASWRVSNLLYGQADQESGRRYSWRVVGGRVTRDGAGHLRAAERVGPPREATDFLGK